MLKKTLSALSLLTLFGCGAHANHNQTPPRGAKDDARQVCYAQGCCHHACRGKSESCNGKKSCNKDKHGRKSCKYGNRKHGRHHKQLHSAVQHASKAEIKLGHHMRVKKISFEHNQVDALPKAVLELAQQTFPKAKVTHYETEMFPGHGLSFEVEVVKEDGTACELSAFPDGTLHYTECDVAPKDLPKPILATLEELYPEGVKVLKAETKHGKKHQTYSIEAKSGSQTVYVYLDSDGKLKHQGVVIEASIRIPKKASRKD